MRVLLTNDDGYDAPGLRALYEAARAIPAIDAIDVIAPLEPQSGKSHAISAEFAAHRRTAKGIGPVIAVSGTPADCIRALFALPDHPRPDWVLAGINRGSNIGVDIYYSGTVAAAREAVILGIPAIALSQFTKPDLPLDWPRSSRQTAALLGALLDPTGKAPSECDAEIHRLCRSALQAASTDQAIPFWNINLPHLPAGSDPQAVSVVPHSTDPHLTDYQEIESQYFRNTGNYQNRPRTAGTDVDEVFLSHIAMTPLSL